ncbi:No apical meristem-associated, C-terminal domain [Sesbania bispinosa]|nr:No apical meristem-associated, C-terminal domain [Sesbania bispinosa]
MGNFPMYPYPGFFHPHMTNMQNSYPMMGQYGLNFQSPQPNLVMHSGSSRGAIGGEGTNEQAQTPVASIAESEVPSKSFEVGLENIVINEEQILGGRTKSKARFTMEEDTLLIQSWLNVSKDAIVGIDQKAESFWRRVRHNYNEYRGEHQERGPIALKSRWQKLNAAVQNLLGATNKPDEGEAFKFEYAWRLLKDNPKWNSDSHQGYSKRSKVSASGEYTSSSASEVPDSL